MASQLYPLGKKAILDGTIALLTDNIKVYGVDTGVETYNAADQFANQITSPVFTSGNLAGKTTTAGVLDANDVTVTGVSGATIEALVLWKDTGSTATSPLIAWFDISTFTPTGGDLTVVWNASGIFAI